MDILDHTLSSALSTSWNATAFTPSLLRRARFSSVGRTSATSRSPPSLNLAATSLDLDTFPHSGSHEASSFALRRSNPHSPPVSLSTSTLLGYCQWACTQQSGTRLTLLIVIEGRRIRRTGSGRLNQRKTTRYRKNVRRSSRNVYPSSRRQVPSVCHSQSILERCVDTERSDWQTSDGRLESKIGTHLDLPALNEFSQRNMGGLRGNSLSHCQDSRIWTGFRGSSRSVVNREPKPWPFRDAQPAKTAATSILDRL